MRHGNKINALSRKSAHRKAMLANMANSLIEHKRINTTVAKAKALRGYVEPLLTRSKNDTTHSRRVVFSYLQNKDAVTELFREIAPKIASRSGGYTRILKTGTRQGDAADMCLIELVDFNETYTTAKKDTKTKSRRSRRGGGAKKAETTDKKEEKVENTLVEDAVVVEETKKDVAPKKEEKPKVEAKKEETPQAEVKEIKKEENTESKEDDKKSE